jgi:AraC-like DNA-binding protein
VNQLVEAGPPGPSGAFLPCPTGARSRQPGVHTVLGAFARLVLRVAGHWGIEPRVLLKGTGIAQSDLEDLSSRLPLESMLHLIERARQLTGEPGLGWYAGLEATVSMYGYLGFGMLSAATLQEAIELLVAFSPLLGTVLTLRLEPGEWGRTSLVIDEQVDLGSARDFVLGGFLVAIWHLGWRISGSTPTGSAELMIEEPEYLERIVRTAPPFAASPGNPCALILRPIRFGQPANRLILERARLEQRLPMADAPAHSLARAQCEQTLGAFTLGFVERVRRCVAAHENLLSLPEVAREMHVSPRTLKRQLALHGLGFRALVEDVRRDRALILLRSGLPLADIAMRLGYSKQSNFGRAFRSWMNLPPGRYRRTAAP